MTNTLQLLVFSWITRRTQYETETQQTLCVFAQGVNQESVVYQRLLECMLLIKGSLPHWQTTHLLTASFFFLIALNFLDRQRGVLCRAKVQREVCVRWQRYSGTTFLFDSAVQWEYLWTVCTIIKRMKSLLCIYLRHVRLIRQRNSKTSGCVSQAPAWSVWAAAIPRI